MLQLIFSLFAMLLFAGGGFAQSGIVWQNSLGGSSSEQVNSIQETTDGGYVVVGWTASGNGDVNGHIYGKDYWVVRLSITGDTLWQRCLGGTANAGGTGHDSGESIDQTFDGGFIVAGWTESFDGDITDNHGGSDCWVVKLDESGNTAWQKCYGGSSWDRAHAIQQTPDSGYIMTGSSASNDGDVSGNHGYNDFWVVKMTKTGNIEWQNSLGGNSNDYGLDVEHTTDGGYIVGGKTFSNDGDVSGNHGWMDYWIVKLDATGALEWQNALGGTSYDEGYSVAQTADGNYMIVGHTDSNDGDVSGYHGVFDYWVAKLDTEGDILWQKCLGGSNPDRGYAIEATADSGCIVAGSSESNDGDVTGHHGDMFSSDFWIAKLDAEGILEWQNSLGGTSSEYAYAVQDNPNGAFAVAGKSMSNDGDVTENHGEYDYWVVKLSPMGIITGISTDKATKPTSLSVSPNPFHSRTEISFELQRKECVMVVVYNIHGQPIKTLTHQEYPAGSHTIAWNGITKTGKSASRGIYLFKMRIGDQIRALRKGMLMK